MLTFGPYSPIGSALECEACVLPSIHSSGELRGALREPTTCFDPEGIVDWGGVLFMSLGFGICGAARSLDQGA